MNKNILGLLARVLDSRQLKTMFQPLVDLENRDIIGHQATVQVQGQSELFSSVRLLGLAARTGQVEKLNALYRHRSVERYAAHKINLPLFFITSVDIPDDESCFRAEFKALVATHGLQIDSLIPVIRCRKTETSELVLAKAISFYRSMGMQVALEVDTQTLSEYMYWGGVLPDFLKLEPFLVREIDENPKNQRRVAEALGHCNEYDIGLIADGISTYLEYDTLLRLGVPYGQGRFLARRARTPVTTILMPQVETLIDIQAPFEGLPKTLASLVADRLTVASMLPLGEAVRLFTSGGASCVPVVMEGALVGVLHAHQLLLHVSEVEQTSLTALDVAQKPVLVLSENTTLWVFTQSIQAKGLADGVDYILLEDDAGQYVGRVYIRDVLAATLDSQYQAMRHANPLSGLPGHVPIDEAVIRLLKEKALFVVASIGINEIKAYNDQYGYVQGDRVILQVAQMLRESVDPELDFLGHIGGDNFIVVFKSSDWFERCESMIHQIDMMAGRFYQPKDRDAGGVSSIDRQGNKVFSPCFSLCIGAVPVFSGKFPVYHQVFEVATEVKARAKATYGGAIYIDQRSYRSSEGKLTVRLS